MKLFKALSQTACSRKGLSIIKVYNNLEKQDIKITAYDSMFDIILWKKHELSTQIWSCNAIQIRNINVIGVSRWPDTKPFIT